MPASESSSEPGRTKTVTIIETKSVEPAKRVVRPAVWRVAQAASSGSAPSPSSSRKRETIRRA